MFEADNEVNGNNEAPLYEYLKNQQNGTLGSINIGWNFIKFLIDKEGNVIE
jgi:glutathione peroxidase